MTGHHRSPFRRRRFLASTGITAVGLTLGPRLTRAAGTVNFYNWDTYIGETTLQDFTEATGIEVQYDLYADNDELFAKLRGGNPGYDVIVPTNDYVERMLQADMLQPLDHSRIPNIANIDPVFMEAPFDPGRQHSLPYMWGTIGIGYRKSAVDAPPTSWGLLYDSDAHAGRISLLGDGQTILQMAMKYMGKSLNDWTPENIKAAEEMVIAQKRHIKAFAPDNGQDLLLSGEVDLAQEWNGDILQVMEVDDDLDYAVPDEGGLRWEDTLAIPKGAPNVGGAHELINFIHDAEVNAAIAEYILYATPNKAGRAAADPSYRDNPAIFPTEQALKASEVSVFPGQEVVRMIDEAFTRIKAA